jgi:uncharacterized protein (TIGR00106 family)
MLASFSVVPVGSGEELKELVAGLVPLLERSGLPFVMGAMQTTVEGEPERVMALIMDCHREMRRRAPRVLTHITIDDRQGATGRLAGKVSDVEALLGRKVAHE